MKDKLNKLQVILTILLIIATLTTSYLFVVTQQEDAADTNQIAIELESIATAEKINSTYVLDLEKALLEIPSVQSVNSMTYDRYAYMTINWKGQIDQSAITEVEAKLDEIWISSKFSELKYPQVSKQSESFMNNDAMVLIYGDGDLYEMETIAQAKVKQIAGLLGTDSKVVLLNPLRRELEIQFDVHEINQRGLALASVVEQLETYFKDHITGVSDHSSNYVVDIGLNVTLTKVKDFRVTAGSKSYKLADLAQINILEKSDPVSNLFGVPQDGVIEFKNSFAIGINTDSDLTQLTSTISAEDDGNMQMKFVRADSFQRQELPDFLEITYIYAVLLLAFVVQMVTLLVSRNLRNVALRRSIKTMAAILSIVALGLWTSYLVFTFTNKFNNNDFWIDIANHSEIDADLELMKKTLGENFYGDVSNVFFTKSKFGVRVYVDLRDGILANSKSEYLRIVADNFYSKPNLLNIQNNEASINKIAFLASDTIEYQKQSQQLISYLESKIGVIETRSLPMENESTTVKIAVNWELLESKKVRYPQLVKTLQAVYGYDSQIDIKIADTFFSLTMSAMSESRDSAVDVGQVKVLTLDGKQVALKDLATISVASNANFVPSYNGTNYHLVSIYSKNNADYAAIDELIEDYLAEQQLENVLLVK